MRVTYASEKFTSHSLLRTDPSKPFISRRDSERKFLASRIGKARNGSESSRRQAKFVRKASAFSRPCGIRPAFSNRSLRSKQKESVRARDSPAPGIALEPII